MKHGLLWYDSDPNKSLGEKIADAAKHYRDKFGAEPTTCYVHPEQINAKQAKNGKLRVLGAPKLLPNHFWLEIEQ